MFYIGSVFSAKVRNILSNLFNPKLSLESIDIVDFTSRIQICVVGLSTGDLDEAKQKKKIELG